MTSVLMGSSARMLCRCQGLGHPAAVGDDGAVGARAHDVGAPEGDKLIGATDRALDTGQPFVHQENHRLGSA